MFTLNYTTNYAPNAPNYTWVVPLVVAIITICGIAATLWVQNRNFKRQISSASATKVAEMRQAWINSLRDEMAKFQSYGVTPGVDAASTREFYEHGTKIELLMNPKDPDYKKLQECLYAFLAVDSVAEKYSANPDYVEICQRILKREWEVLKDEIKAGE